ARERADELGTVARRDADGARTAAAEAYEETEHRAAELRARQAEEHGARRADADRAAAADAAGLADRHDEQLAAAEARLEEARRALARTEEEARHGQEDADAKAGELLAGARLKSERVERETERVLREHDEARDEIHSHMDHIRNSLAALTGRPVTAATQDADDADDAETSEPGAEENARKPEPEENAEKAENAENAEKPEPEAGSGA
ncbi:hypothetical protein ABZ615_19760, partial [Streptomyces sp. NPDC007325]